MIDMHRTVRWAGVALLLACGALAAPALKAAEAGAYRVSVAGLDLRSPAGADALAARVRPVAAEACGLAAARGYARRRQARRCVDATVAATMAAARQGAPAARMVAAN